MAMITLRHLLNHTANPEHLDLKTSSLGLWCHYSLKSKVRDLRISAGRALVVYLQAGPSNRSVRQNRRTALELLQDLSHSDDASMQETCITTMGLIASIISDEDETNIVLLRLVEYLGHSNPLICGLAYDELLSLSGHSSFRAMRMFEPFWSNIAISAVKDLQNRPQTAQRLCDLLNIQISDFLRLTQSFTVPYLVLTKKRDILQRIADASSMVGNTANLTKRLTIADICTSPEQLPAILSCLLLQPSSDPQTLIQSLLTQAAPELAALDFIGLMKTDPMRIAFELLRSAGEGDESRSARVYIKTRTTGQRYSDTVIGTQGDKVSLRNCISTPQQFSQKARPDEGYAW